MGRPRRQRQSCEDFLHSHQGHASGAPGRPTPADSEHGARESPRGSEDGEGFPPWPSAGVAKGTRRSGAAARPAASALISARRGPLPPRGFPRTRPARGPRRHAPRVTALARASCRPPRAGHPVAAQDHSQGRTCSLRSGRSTLTVISLGKDPAPVRRTGDHRLCCFAYVVLRQTHV